MESSPLTLESCRSSGFQIHCGGAHVVYKSADCAGNRGGIDWMIALTLSTQYASAPSFRIRISGRLNILWDSTLNPAATATENDMAIPCCARPWIRRCVEALPNHQHPHRRVPRPGQMVELNRPGFSGNRFMRARPPQPDALGQHTTFSLPRGSSRGCINTGQVRYRSVHSGCSVEVRSPRCLQTRSSPPAGPGKRRKRPCVHVRFADPESSAS